MILIFENKSFIDLSKEEKSNIVGNIAVLKPMVYEDNKENAFVVLTSETGETIEKKAIVYGFESAVAVATLFDSEKQ